MSSILAPARTSQRSTIVGDPRPLPPAVVGLEPGGVAIDSLTASRRRVGLLVIEGFLIAELEAGRARVAWLVGADDLIRPWQMDELPLTRGTSWRALTAAAVLPVAGTSWDPATGGPEVTERLLSRAACTSRWLLAQALILSAPSTQERLLMLFALYGERWGKVTPQGVRLDMPLTHDLLGRLCGARRPTVTLALRSLINDGFLARVSPDTWLLPQGLWTDDHPPPPDAVSSDARP